MNERTLVILKPDAIQRGLIGEIIARLEKTGLRIAAMKLVQVSDSLARTHYAEHEGKPFFPGLIEVITSGPAVAMVLEGPRAIEITRKTMGNTDPAQSPPGSIRGDFGLDVGRNLVHGSDGPESAAREVANFFLEEEILGYTRATDSWIIE